LQPSEKKGDNMNRTWLCGLLIGLAVAGGAAAKVIAQTTPPTPPQPATTILAQSTIGPLLLTGHLKPRWVWSAKLKTTGVSDFYVVDNKFNPGDSTGWHQHPGPSLIFVVNGTVTNYDSDDPACAPHAYSKGSLFVDSGGKDVHMLRNESGAAAETIAVQFLPTGATRKTPAPEPPNCHVS
jgi:quercetin dioxygenase-like cupin family protein